MVFEGSVCREIGDEEYLIGNTSVLCTDYRDEIKGILYPFVVVWVVLIPGILFKCLLGIGK